VFVPKFAIIRCKLVFFRSIKDGLYVE
jgi:hypothetical protein